MPFTMVQDLQLIKLVKKNSILYSNLHDNFTCSDKRNAAWEKIGEELGAKAYACKSRWLNIRDNLRRKIREREKLPPSQRAKYKYEDELAFLIPYFKGLSYSRDFLEQENDIDDDEVSGLENVEEVYLDNEEVEMLEQKPCVSNFILNGASTSYDEGVDRNSRHNSALDYNEKDSIKIFLDAVDSTLRNLNPYYLNKAKSKIFQVAQDCEREQIVNKGEPPGTDKNDKED